MLSVRLRQALHKTNASNFFNVTSMSHLVTRVVHGGAVDHDKGQGGAVAQRA